MQGAGRRGAARRPEGAERAGDDAPSSTTDPASTAVLAAHRAGWKAFEQALATANPADPALAATMVGRGTFTLHPKIVSMSAADGHGCRLRLQHRSARLCVHRKAGAAGHGGGERRGARNTRARRRSLEDLQADRDGWEMRAWLVIPVAGIAGADEARGDVGIAAGSADGIVIVKPGADGRKLFALGLGNVEHWEELEASDNPISLAVFGVGVLVDHRGENPDGLLSLADQAVHLPPGALKPATWVASWH
ncbi:MAG: hypothetical protein ACYDGN_17610 [Acidimicrobiales bacterium]